MIDPRLRGEPAPYQRMDWNDAQLKDWCVVEPGGAFPLWEAWSEKEERYRAEQRPRDSADLIVDGSGR